MTVGARTIFPNLKIETKNRFNLCPTYPDLLVHPDHLTGSEIEMIKDENLFTVEGLVTKRQNIQKINAERALRKMARTALNTFQGTTRD